jgi:NAD(P)-dependent dehydrogenase (short-subunit alcohol dehydrogenase family)
MENRKQNANRLVLLQLGPPTVLINNAAIVNGKTLLDSTFEELDRSLTTNLTAHFYTLKTFLPYLLRSETGGTVVTVSSVMGHIGAARLADYAAAKAGLTALHKSLTAELKGTEVRTVLVEPGQLSTPLFYGVQTPSAFLAPVVEPVEIVKEIIAAVDGGCSTHVAQPFYARWIDYYSVLPIGVQALVRRWASVDEAMKTFVGREGKKAATEGEGELI